MHYTSLVTVLAASAAVVSAVPPRVGSAIKAPRTMSDLRQELVKDAGHHARSVKVAKGAVKQPKSMTNLRKEAFMEAPKKDDKVKKADKPMKDDNEKRSEGAVKQPKKMTNLRKETFKEAPRKEDKPKKENKEKRSEVLSAQMTPHSEYSSSIDVAGCKINHNRIVHFPSATSCDDICVQITNGDRTEYALNIDSSTGTYDLSYDLWNMLVTGKSATDEPHMDGGLEMQYQFVDNSLCAPLLGDDCKLPLSGPNSMNHR